MPDCIIMRRGSRKTITYYVWNRYNRNETVTYYWNRYNRNSTTTYYWDRYNRVSTIIYNWNRYNIEEQTIYVYNRYKSSVYFHRTEDNWVSTGRYNRRATYRIMNTTDVNMQYLTAGFGATWFTVYFGDNTIEYHYAHGSTLSIKTIGPGQTVTLREGQEYIIPYHRTSGNIDYILNSPYIPTNFTRWHYDTDSEYDVIDNYRITESINREDLIDTVYLSTKQYEDDEWVSGVIYEYVGTDTQQIQGSANGTVTSTSSSSYPTNGVSGNYWYVYSGTTTQYSQGSTSYGQVSSTNRSAYPDNSYSGSYWYVYSTSSTSYSQGSYIDQVSSTSRTAYPDNSYSGSYWYVYSTSQRTYSQGSYIDRVTSSERNSFPDNSYSGSYWYVYQGTAEEVLNEKASLNSILSQ